MMAWYVFACHLAIVSGLMRQTATTLTWKPVNQPLTEIGMMLCRPVPVTEPHFCPAM